MTEKVFSIGNSRAALVRAITVLSSLLVRADDDLELVLRPKKYKRTAEQNKRYWALLGEISERLPVQGVVHTSEVWAEYFKIRFIGKDEMVLPNGKRVERAISTTTLDKVAFAEYMTRIEVWAAEHGILLAEAA